MSSYTDLIVYQRACELADELREAVRTWPSLDRWTSGVQMMDVG